MSTDLMALTRTAVKRSGLSMFEIAKRAELAYSRVHDVVTGHRPAARSDTLGKILDVCGAELKLVQKSGGRTAKRSKGR